MTPPLTRTNRRRSRRATEVVRGHYGDTGEDGYLFGYGVAAERVQWAAQGSTGA